MTRADSPSSSTAPSQTLRIAQLGPVVSVSDQDRVVPGRRELPNPFLPERLSPDFGGFPGDEPALGEIDNVVLTIHPLGQGRDEGTAGPTHSLAFDGRTEVVVSVPFRLPLRIGDELEHRLGGG